MRYKYYVLGTDEDDCYIQGTNDIAAVQESIANGLAVLDVENNRILSEGSVFEIPDIYPDELGDLDS